jgi:hypothetical protein
MSNTSGDLYNLRPVIFHYREEYANGDTSLQYGLIAEEVEKVNPNLVAYDNDGMIYSVKYQLLAPLILNELQKEHKLNQSQSSLLLTLQNQVVELNGQNAGLRTENASLHSSLADLQLKLQTLSAKVDALTDPGMATK